MSSLSVACALVLSLFATRCIADENSKWVEPEKSALMSQPGELPFYPHRANTTGNKILKTTDFDNAQVCGACHQEIFSQWRSSVMSQAWEDPLYRALLKKASEATNGKVDNFCTGCHTPVGLTTGQINSQINRASVESTAEHHPMPGVDCETCHNISARTGLDNGAFVLTPMENGQRTKFGPYKDAVSPYHATVYSPLHTRSDFCGTCHNVTHPFSSAAVERTYDEWQDSQYSFTGKQCQGCHMPEAKAKAAIMGPERDNVASHWFTGGNVTLLKHFGKDDGAQRSRDMLKQAAEISFVDMPKRLVPGTTAIVKVDVLNKSAGHKLPTGFPEGREMWIDFQVTDASGAMVYRLGQVKNGKTEPGTEDFRVHLGDKDGHEVNIEVWKVARVLSDTRVLPNGSDVRKFAFEVPAFVKGPLKITATLNYWPFSQSLADELLGAGKLPVEITPMTSTEASVVLGLRYMTLWSRRRPSPAIRRRARADPR